MNPANYFDSCSLFGFSYLLSIQEDTRKADYSPWKIHLVWKYHPPQKKMKYFVTTPLGKLSKVTPSPCPENKALLSMGILFIFWGGNSPYGMVFQWEYQTQWGQRVLMDCFCYFLQPVSWPRDTWATTQTTLLLSVLVWQGCYCQKEQCRQNTLNCFAAFDIAASCLAGWLGFVCLLGGGWHLVSLLPCFFSRISLPPCMWWRSKWRHGHLTTLAMQMQPLGRCECIQFMRARWA